MSRVFLVFCLWFVFLGDVTNFRYFFLLLAVTHGSARVYIFYRDSVFLNWFDHYMKWIWLLKMKLDTTLSRNKKKYLFKFRINMYYY